MIKIKALYERRMPIFFKCNILIMKRRLLWSKLLCVEKNKL